MPRPQYTDGEVSAEFLVGVPVIELVENTSNADEHLADFETVPSEEHDQAERIASQSRTSQPTEVAPPLSLAISADSIIRGTAVRRAFETAPDGGEVAERLLEEFAAGEVPIVRELQNVEGALVALLSRTLTDPALAVRVAGVLKETVAVSAAVRRRTEGSLQAAASLRAQRLFLAAQRRQGGHRGE